MKHLSTLILFIACLFTANNAIAQRVFAPSEIGLLVELKDGSITKGFLCSHPVYPRKMENIITEPFKAYIYFDEEIEVDPEELFISQIGIINKQDMFQRVGAIKKNQTKLMKQILKKISPNLYEISFSDRIFLPTTEEEIKNVKTGANLGIGTNSKFVIGFDPNKKHKKEGKTKKYWYANISQLPYELTDIEEWTTEQAIESVLQLISDGKTSIQLFTSIVPQPQIIENQIQYVIVQNPNQAISQSNVQQPPVQQHLVQEEQEIVSDIDKNIPYHNIKNENAFALIIANEDYNKVAPVPFAKRDGNKVKEYLIRCIGLDKGHITIVENATLNDMRYELNRLNKISEAYNGDCSFIVYYCGHGIPDEKDGNSYLLPIDGYGTDVNTAYSLNDLYSQLGELKAHKTILFTDACFSGAGKEGNMLVTARGIAIKSQLYEASGNLIAFSACQGDETAYSYKEKGHGLLTYYFLKKLQETAGKVTLGELEEYIVDNVGKTAIVINGKSQTPSVSVSPNFSDSWREQTLFE